MTPREEMQHLKRTSADVRRYLHLAGAVAGSGCSAKKAAATKRNLAKGNVTQKALRAAAKLAKSP